MDLDEIKALLAVAETGSFVAAARMTSMTRSTLRRRVDELEARIGAPLLERSALGAQLTPIGELVVREGRLVAEHARAVLQAARNGDHESSRPVNIVLQQGLPPDLMAMMFHFMGNALNIRCNVEFSANPRASLVDDADIVVAVGHEPEEGPWQAIRVREVKERMLASEAYLEQHGRPTQLSELSQHTLAVWNGGSGGGHVLPLRNGGVFEVDARIFTSDIHLLHTIASSGSALVYVPDARIGTVVAGLTILVPVLEDLVGREVFGWLIVARSATSSARVQRILSAMSSLFDQGSLGLGA